MTALGPGLWPRGWKEPQRPRRHGPCDQRRRAPIWNVPTLFLKVRHFSCWRTVVLRGGPIRLAGGPRRGDAHGFLPPRAGPVPLPAAGEYCSLCRVHSLLREACLLLPAAWPGLEAALATGKTHRRAQKGVPPPRGAREVPAEGLRISQAKESEKGLPGGGNRVGQAQTCATTLDQEPGEAGHEQRARRSTGRGQGWLAGGRGLAVRPARLSPYPEGGGRQRPGRRAC